MERKKMARAFLFAASALICLETPARADSDCQAPPGIGRATIVDTYIDAGRRQMIAQLISAPDEDDNPGSLTLTISGQKVSGHTLGRKDFLLSAGTDAETALIMRAVCVARQNESVFH